MTAILKRQKNILQLLLMLVALGSKQSLAVDHSSFESRHAFWAEIGGMGIGLPSAQYEFRLFEGIGVLTGINFYPFPSQAIHIPVAATFRVPFLAYFDLPNHQIEVGLGTTYVSEGHRGRPEYPWGIGGSIGYRYHPKEGGFVFRFNIIYMVFGFQLSHSSRSIDGAGPGLSFGYAF